MKRVLIPVLVQGLRVQKFERPDVLIGPVGLCFDDNTSIGVRPEFNLLRDIHYFGSQCCANVMFGCAARIYQLNFILSLDQREQLGDVQQ